jgi:chromate reductase, NAD(P)H dehydrogenase (quinone)
MNILGFAGSNSTNSINKKLVKYAISLLEGSNHEVLDLNDFEMPIFSVEREKENGVPQLAKDFAIKIDAADLLVVSLAEHNGAYTTAFKNIFDWLSRIPQRKAFGNKPILLMATSPGPRGGATVLEIAKNRLPFSGGIVLESFSLPSFHENFSEKGQLINKEMENELVDKIKNVIARL